VNRLIGVSRINIDLELVSGTFVCQEFITPDFTEVIRTVLSDDSNMNIKKIDVMPNMNPIPVNSSPMGFIY